MKSSIKGFLVILVMLTLLFGSFACVSASSNNNGNSFGKANSQVSGHGFTSNSQSVVDYIGGTHKIDDPFYWQNETGVPLNKVKEIMTLSDKYEVNPNISFILLGMGKDLSEVEDHLKRLNLAQVILRNNPKNAIQKMAQLYGINHKQIQELISLGASLEEVHFLMYFITLEPDRNLRETMTEALIEARAVSWVEVQIALKQAMIELGLTETSSDKTMSIMGIMTASTQTSFTNPATGYDSGKITPFQPYFQNNNETISPVTGSLNYQQTDLSLPGRSGLDLVISRFYSSNVANIEQMEVTILEDNSGYYYPTEKISFSHWIDDDYDYEKHVYLLGHCVEPGGYYRVCRVIVKQYVAGSFDELVYEEETDDVEWVDYPDYSVTVCSTTPEMTFVESRNGLGTGWSFGFPCVEHYQGTNSGIFLHMGDGRVFKYKSSSSSGLENYLIKDMLFKTDSSYSDEQVRSYHSLTLKDGTKYYFGEQGQLLVIQDRYNNRIQFKYDSEHRITEITDTVGRQVIFDGYLTDELTLTVKDKNGSEMGTIRYHLSNINGYNTARNRKQLDKVTGLAGHEIEYKYDKVEAVFYYDYVGNGEVQEGVNHYLALTEVIHPMGLGSNVGKTRFIWESPMPRKHWMNDTSDPSVQVSGDDFQEYLRIKSRQDECGAGIENKVIFEYTPWANGKYITVKKTETEDFLGMNKLVETLEFNDNNLLLTQSMTWRTQSQNSVTQVKSYEYFKEQLPSTEITYYEALPSVKLTVNYGYDQYGNILWKHDGTHRSEYEYFYNDVANNFVKEERHKIKEISDGALWRVTKYELTGDHNNIKKETHSEVTGVLGAAQEYTGPTSNYMSSGEYWIYPVTNNVSNFNFTISYSLGFLGKVRFKIYVREEGTEDWILKKDSNTISTFWAKSDSQSCPIVLGSTGNYEVKVVVTSGGKAKVSKFTYRAQPYTTTESTDKAQYDYVYLSDADNYKLNYVQTNNGSSKHRSTITYDIKYNAYPAEIDNRIDDEAETYGISATYDAFGRIETLTESENKIDFTQTFDYDKLGRLTEVIEPAVNLDGLNKQYTRKWDYDDKQLKVTAVIKDGGDVVDKVIYNYDALGRIISEQRYLRDEKEVVSATTVREVSYNMTGLVSEEKTIIDSDTIITNLYEYDNLGRLVKTYFDSSDSAPYEQINYKDQFKPEKENIDANANVTKSYYDEFGNLVDVEQQVTGLNYKTHFTYDLLNRLVTQEDPNNLITSYEYSVLGKVTKINMPKTASGTGILSAHEFTYDNLGNLKSANYGYGTIKYSYDAWNRVKEVDYGESQVVTTYGHFKSSGNTSVKNGKITTAKVITETDDIDHPKSEVITKSDPLGNVILEQWGLKNSAGSRETYSLKYDYDGASRMTQLTYPDGQSVSYVYDTISFGILKKINGPAINGSSGLISSFGYTCGGVLETINYGTQATTTFKFDLRGRPEQIKTVSAGTAIFNQKYEYDDLNNITSIKEPGDSDVFNPNTQPQQNFTYDQRGRLTSAKYNNPLNTQLNYEYTYGYDGSDNRTLLNQTDNTYERYTYHAASGQVLTSVIRNSGTETFTHNAAGAMKKRTLAGVTTEYSYDQAGRLKKVIIGSVLIAEYQYDAYGRLIKTTEGTQETIRLPIGNETGYEKVITPGMPTVERRYIIALGKYIARDEISAGLTSRVYYHGDHLGSTRALSGDDTGSSTYDPFGNIVESMGDAADHGHQFTGKPIHSTGLYYYGARFYDPTLGRFINMDPAKDGNNWWVYCGNNPLRYVDPTGKNFWDVLDVGSFLYSAYRFVTDPSWGTGAGLILDTVGLLPIIPSTAAVRGAVNVIDNVTDTARIGNKVDDLVDIGQYASQATKHAESSMVMLGKYAQDGVSYLDKAREYAATYFHLQDYDNLARTLGNNKMWEINRQFLNQQWAAGKDFIFSHNPWNATGSFEKEVLHLIDLGVKDFVETGNGLWKAIK